MNTQSTTPESGRTEEPLLQLSNVSKSYGSTRALSDATLSLNGGEIHGLLGQNGSGKSTLIKVLAGVVTPDSGSLRLRGEDIPLPLTTSESDRLGLRFVHQNLGLVDSLSVGENLLIHRFASGHRHINWGSLFAEARSALDLYGLNIDPRATVGSLTSLERAQVAIARALAPMRDDRAERRSAILVLDEPTVYLPKKEVGVLFDMLDRVIDDGHGVLLVTHRLSELLEHTSRVSILRDARIRDTVETSTTTENTLVELAVGSGWRDSDSTVPAPANPDGDTLEHSVAVQDLHTQHLSGFGMRLRAGQILGLTGLAESGYEEVLYALFGASDKARGVLELDGTRVQLDKLNPAAAIAAGIALVPVNRLAQGVAGSASIEESVTLPVLNHYFRKGRLRLAEATAGSTDAIKRYGIVATGPAARVDTLSGGNQQKVLIAKWLQKQPSLLLLHEPSQGVDVRARHDIWRYVREAAAGCPVLVASSDYDELAELCTEVAIVADGIVLKTLTGDQLSADVIAAETLKLPGRPGMSSEGGEAA
ncbi:sugar ABC transporter ATP-binding protein [Rhodococcus sp. T7]|uniref:sugar ABC transporter ATP-binding protein n=1 Tax=Rhodococcus sp. T7 TaxID=627444 RepID=UPI001359030C|nr:sugar ABC transporter ATP-binding protein [Rhodococcus sp. T7]KAF0957165.1 Galactose/methyl galactoside import ATP-binding protein MglA [Rhodococcus sp. T7]KAF0959003.1 Galactose/methyl galactoside import ATP-binding protein MglA [Rhodococcus sp. T7]